VAAIFKLEIGDRFHESGRVRTVVGLIENPGDLSDEFALVASLEPGAADWVTVLLDARSDRFDAFRLADGRRPPLFDRRVAEGTYAAVGALVLTTVGLLLVCLVAAAGFAAVAQRRLRAFGMLAAVGATERHVRLAMLANGGVAAVIGAAVGLAGWIAIAPSLETALGHRIGRLDLPWWAIGVAMLLSIATAVAAAWWPARALARMPIVSALSARPPRPRPARRSAARACLLVLVGVGGLAIADRKSVLFAVSGAVATTLGVLLLAPSP
jgi:putative ABC transport system permease protein